MQDIPDYDSFIKIEPITKGWSDDKKYYIETADGRRMLLRVSDISEFERKKAEYGMMERVYGLGVLTSQPLGFSLCNDGKSCYSLSDWLDGENLESALPKMTDTEQYVMGLKAGEILRQIHSFSAPERSDNRITLIHGDYHTENIILHKNGFLYVIDFNMRHDDPWWDFCAVPVGKEAHTYYQTGLIKGYFRGEPPFDFFDVISKYFAQDVKTRVSPDDPLDVRETGLRHVENILRWFDNMNNPVPTWYLKDFYIQWVDGVPYKLKAPFDFSFLGKYSKVFKVFDDQDSGNICFGVADGESKYFVKFAGAPTERSRISTDEAVKRIKSTVPIYRDLAHPVLTKLISAEEVGGGFAMIFEWTDAECMGRQYPQSREKFLQMPLVTRLRVFDEILEFHTHVAKQGYVAIDFYDGCIMYDFNIGRTTLCDIEFYAKMPYNNPIGRMWGSSRFMSPEEFELDAVIDEITNVYTMGATAFAFFGDERDRSIEKWKLSKELFAEAKKAVSDDRNLRQQSIKQLIEEWSAAKV